MQKSTFREWTLAKIDKTFGAKQVAEDTVLTDWLAMKTDLTAIDEHYLSLLQRTLRIGVYDWNETELENKFISPLIVYAELDSYDFSYFLERDLEGVIDDHYLTGRVDGMIASGFREPDKPYFCLYEYKKEKDPEGDPAAQALIAMMIAQDKNADNLPVYGGFIIGKNWQFMVLKGRKYAISNTYSADSDDIYNIFQAIKALKTIVSVRMNL
jgi:hypothetical protein